MKPPVPGVVLRGSAPALEQRFDAVRERLGLPQALPARGRRRPHGPPPRAGPRPAERRDLRDVPVRDDRPARQPRPRPGAAPRAARRRLPRPLRDRRRRRVGRSRRRAGRRGVAARADASTRPIAARRCTRRSCRRARRACCPTATARPSCWSSTSTATGRARRSAPIARSCAAGGSSRTTRSGRGTCRCSTSSGRCSRSGPPSAGAIELDAPAQVVVPDDGPAGYRLEWEERRPSEAWNAQISLAANAAVGDELARRGHGRPPHDAAAAPARPCAPSGPPRRRSTSRGRAAASSAPSCADAAAGRPRARRSSSRPGGRSAARPITCSRARRPWPTSTPPSAASTRTPPRRCAASPTATCSRRWSATRSTRDELRPPGATSWRPSDARRRALRARASSTSSSRACWRAASGEVFDACVLSDGRLGAHPDRRPADRRAPARGPRPRPGRRRPRAARAGRRGRGPPRTSSPRSERRVPPAGGAPVRSRPAKRASMATGLSFTGLASGVDTDAIVTALMQIERTPQTRMQGRLDQANARLAGFEQTCGQLDALRGAADALRGVGVFSPAPWASSSDTARLTATAGGSAVRPATPSRSSRWPARTSARSGRRSPRRARTTCCTSAPARSSTSPCRPGDTIAAIAGKINAAGGDVSASVVEGKLRLTSRETGTAHAVSVVAPTASLAGALTSARRWPRPTRASPSTASPTCAARTPSTTLIAGATLNLQAADRQHADHAADRPGARSTWTACRRGPQPGHRLQRGRRRPARRPATRGRSATRRPPPSATAGSSSATARTRRSTTALQRAVADPVTGAAHGVRPGRRDRPQPAARPPARCARTRCRAASCSTRRSCGPRCAATPPPSSAC